MTIMTLWGQRKNTYPGQHGLELLEAWDENSMDANPGSFEDVVKVTREDLKDEFSQFEVIEIDINDRLLELAFKPSKVPGHIQLPVDKVTEAGI
jgi:hypothetical protein